MKCPTCVAEGKTSRVYPLGGFVTCMASYPYYDEAGNYHHHDPNTHTGSYQCSEGHKWSDSSKSPCPTCGDKWWKDEAEARAKEDANPA